MSNFNIAIDGPSGAGKSTLARRLAKRFGMTYVDTGAMYRAIALYMHRLGIDCADREAVIGHLGEVQVTLEYGEEGQRVLLCGQDVSQDIRHHEISECTSKVSVIPEVREYLTEMQRGLAKTKSCIMDGRDIGTVVLPNADLKIFLTASPEDRARRRQKELAQKGEELPFEQVLADIRQRDERDSIRAVAPLRPAQDSVIVDTTGNTLEQSVEQLEEILVKHLGVSPVCG